MQRLAGTHCALKQAKPASHVLSAQLSVQYCWSPNVPQSPLAHSSSEVQAAPVSRSGSSQGAQEPPQSTSVSSPS
jgi:hypothetical protein